ncbi:MAG: hypothetical protein ACNS60_13085 [Candidatus Cyclobacteriaceae bacterium M2_1C_046]
MRVFIIFIICILSYSVQAQELEEVKPNHLYLEHGGVVLGPFSFNYERLFFFNNLIVTTRIGAGYYFEGLFGDDFVVYPVTSSILIGGDKLYFELGAGPVFSFTPEESIKYNYGIIKWYSGIVGVRYQKLTGRFSARFIYTPKVYTTRYYDYQNYTESYGLALESFAGFSFGYRF